MGSTRRGIPVACVVFVSPSELKRWAINYGCLCLWRPAGLVCVCGLVVREVFAFAGGGVLPPPYAYVCILSLGFDSHPTMEFSTKTNFRSNFLTNQKTAGHLSPSLSSV